MRVEELTLPRPGPAQLHQAGLAPALEMEEAGWCRLVLVLPPAQHKT